MPIASVHVNFKPLSGNWDDHNWDQQSARCGNNFMSGPTPPQPPPLAAVGIIWQVSGLSSVEPNPVVFDVAVDLPDDDGTLFTSLRNGASTTFLPTPTITDTGPPPASVPMHGSQRWDAYYHRGIYIAREFGASEPFMINVLGANEGNPCGLTIIANLTIKDTAQATFHMGGVPPMVETPPSTRGAHDR